MKFPHLHPSIPAAVALVVAVLAILFIDGLLAPDKEEWTAPEIPDEPIVEQPIDPLPEDETEARKAELINTLLPRIQYNNRRLLEKRARLKALGEQAPGNELEENDREWLEELARRYRVPHSGSRIPDGELVQSLLQRIDIVPADLALAQAAIESAWGSSRFAREGNNYFGQWCFRPGCGMVPARRPAGRTYEVESYPSAGEAVRRYMHNLNSHPSYETLRDIREQARHGGEPITGTALAPGLLDYAEIGEQYIHKVRQMIRQNNFDAFSHY